MAFAKKQIDTEAKSVAILFEDGTEARHSLNDLSQEMIVQLALHGLSQKLGDSYSGAEAAVSDGEAPSKVAYAQGTVSRVWGSLTSNEWSAKREGSGSGSVTLLAKAIAQALGVGTPEEAQAKLDSMDKETRAKIRNVPKVALAVANLKAEQAARAAAKAQAAAGTDTGTDLAGLFA